MGQPNLQLVLAVTLVVLLAVMGLVEKLALEVVEQGVMVIVDQNVMMTVLMDALITAEELVMKIARATEDGLLQEIAAVIVILSVALLAAVDVFMTAGLVMVVV